MRRGLSEPALDAVWRAAAAAAREALAAVERGERMATRRELQDWRSIVDHATAWGLT